MTKMSIAPLSLVWFVLGFIGGGLWELGHRAKQDCSGVSINKERSPDVGAGLSGTPVNTTIEGNTFHAAKSSPTASWPAACKTLVDIRDASGVDITDTTVTDANGKVIHCPDLHIPPKQESK